MISRPQGSLAVIHEDERLIAVSKPTGQLVIFGRGDLKETLKDQVALHTGGKVFVVHRLDRQASGLVLFAKDAVMHRSLCSQFESRQVHKIYLALVLGSVEGEGIVERPIRAFGSGRMGISDDGKPSLTRYRVRERFSGATLLEVEPVTGRRHQIRVHLYATGHPLVGDSLYGENKPVAGARRLMLHSLEISFKADKPLKLRAQPGDDFMEVLERFK